MRSIVALFTAASASEMVSLASEPVSMLLWGITLLALCSMLRRPSSRTGESVSVRFQLSDSRSMDGVPAIASRS